MGERENKDEKDFFIVDKSTGEVVGETNNKNSGVKSVLLTIAGVVLGFLVYYIFQLLISFVLAFLISIPIIGRFLYYPADYPFVLMTMPPVFGVSFGSWVCTKISGRGAPVCVAIMAFYLFCFLWAVFWSPSAQFKWSYVEQLAATVGTAIVCYKMRRKDLEP